MSIECNTSTCGHLDRIESKVDKIIDSQTDLKVDIAKIKKDVSVNTSDLTEHKEGVIQNRKRIANLERPAIMIDGIKKVAIWTTAVIGLLIALKNYKII